VAKLQAEVEAAADKASSVLAAVTGAATSPDLLADGLKEAAAAALAAKEAADAAAKIPVEAMASSQELQLLLQSLVKLLEQGDRGIAAPTRELGGWYPGKYIKEGLPHEPPMLPPSEPMPLAASPDELESKHPERKHEEAKETEAARLNTSPEEAQSENGETRALCQLRAAAPREAQNKHEEPKAEADVTGMKAKMEARRLKLEKEAREEEAVLEAQEEAKSKVGEEAQGEWYPGKYLKDIGGSVDSIAWERSPPKFDAAWYPGKYLKEGLGRSQLEAQLGLHEPLLKEVV